METQIAFFDPFTLIALGVGLISAAVSLSTKPKNRNRLLDQGPTSLSELGSFVPVVYGRQKVSPVILFAGERKVFSNRIEETAWHALAIGPGTSLLQIYVAGNAIGEWVPTNRAGHPSGTITTTIPNVGRITIFWGEPDQPLNAVLGLPNNVGVTSRWPHLFYVMWQGFQLKDGTWPEIEYEIEVYPSQQELVAPAKLATGLPRDTVVSANVDVRMIPRAGNPTIVVKTNPFTRRVDSGGDTRLNGHPYIYLAGEQWEQIGFSDQGEILNTVSGDPFLLINFQFIPVLSVRGNHLGFEPINPELLSGAGAQPFTTFILDKGIDPVVAINQVGVGYNIPFMPDFLKAQVVLRLEVSGANLAAVVAQLLYGEFPHGIEMSTDDVDIDSLLELSNLAQNEKFAVNMQAFNGEEVASIVTKLTTEFLFYQYLDVNTGKYKYTAIRKTSPQERVILNNGTIIEVTKDEVNISDYHTPSIPSFTYASVSTNYRPDSVIIHSNINSIFYPGASPESEELHSMIDAISATAAAKRIVRQKAFGRAKRTYRLAGSGVDTIRPGHVLVHENGVTHRKYRVSKITYSSSSPIVIVEAESDFF